MSIAYLGPAGTYSHQAALQLYKDPSELRPCSSISECFTLLEHGQVTASVVPIENSTNGSVVYALDNLRDLYHCRNNKDIAIIRDTYVAIQHNLMSRAQDISKIKRIYSHPQVWGQVQEWYAANIPAGVERIDTSSTAKAAELANNDPESAAIAGYAAAKIYDMPILANNISTQKDNTTRFLELSSKENSVSYSAHKAFTTAVSFVVEDKMPGALCKALNAFSEQDLNLTSIVSRPSTFTKWKYCFFIEVDGHMDQTAMAAAVANMRQYCIEVCVLGSFLREENA